MSETAVHGSAALSEDRKYRFWLLRVWDESKPVIAIIGVNPSTADEQENDATIRKDIGFATRLGFGGILKLNLAAYRSRDPKECRKAYNPVSLSNTAESLAEYVRLFGATKVVAAWGRNGVHFDYEASRVVEIFPELWCFGRNSDGTPRHTLMLPYSTPLEIFTK